MGMTPRGLETLKVGEWDTDGGLRGEGRLAARRMPSGGVAFYFRYTLPDGKRDALALGSFDKSGKDGLSLEQARELARHYSKRYREGAKNLREVLEQETREAERKRLATAEAEAQAKLRQSATLGALLQAYVGQLRKLGKSSARAVELAFARHVQDAFPKLWKKPANEIDTDELLSILNRVTDADKLREAGKLRSYLRAAYGAGVKARKQANAIAALRELRIVNNPAKELSAIEGGAGGQRGRYLSVGELRRYWARLESLPMFDRALLQLHLLTGGQRAEQLTRITQADFDADAPMIRLQDPKGRRKTVRIHKVPLIEPALSAFQSLRAFNRGKFPISTDGGESPASYHTVQHRVRKLAEQMQEAGELEHGPFTAGDVRRTVETQLAALGVSLEVRAQLQSHGLGGVQAKHYDKHDYLAEKRAALEALFNLITQASAKVTTIKRKRA